MASMVGGVRDSWGGAVGRHPSVWFADALLRGVGQVMFQNNPVTGLLFLVGILVNSATLFAAGVLGLLASTAAAITLRVDRALIGAGLFGFNGVLVGIGLAFFLEVDVFLAVYVVVGGAASTVVMAAFARAFGPLDLPALTAPFVLTTWLLLFGFFALGALQATEFVAGPALPDPQAAVQTELRELATGSGGLTFPNLANAVLRGPAQVFFQDNLVTGAIFLVALAVSSRISAAMALLGSVIGVLVALAAQADGVFVWHGLYGFNPVLTAIAIGGVFFVADWRSTLYAVLGAVVTSFAFAAIAVALAPYGMPALTAPFVLVTWLFLLPAGMLGALRYVPLAEVDTPERTRAAVTRRATA